MEKDKISWIVLKYFRLVAKLIVALEKNYATSTICWSNFAEKITWLMVCPPEF